MPLLLDIYETEGKKTLAKLRFAKKIKSICLTDLLENNLNQVINVNGKQQYSLFGNRSGAI